ncbi:hypothetical protein D7Z54_23555 [Salibacterium salarium]|uniref:Competence protein ComGD n=1 Tax=Salibacterium salarium TaxID=284579 RepID=A0A428MXQ8_9BACI|nr:competence type IV pilus minor pilin ComGD [Salibacterium salarium]RSL30943.1 hypothetical protein D7Z54_23555 [Salibacterium salarium]
MIKHIDKENGHTLVEMVIVLFIITVTTAVPIISFHSLQEKKSIQYFMDLLEEDLRYAQQRSYANEELTYVQAVRNHYYIRTSGIWEDPIKQRKIPEGVSFHEVTMRFDEIGFKNNGNARKAGTIFIDTPKANYKLVILVGKGRVYIEKL